MGTPFADLPGADEQTAVAFSQRETEQLITTWRSRVEALIQALREKGVELPFLYDLLQHLDSGRRLSTAQIEAVIRIEQRQDRPERGKGRAPRRYEGWTGGW